MLPALLLPAGCAPPAALLPDQVFPMKHTPIEWCDHTFNAWEGCTKVSAGCAHCYAETRNARWNGGTAPNWGPGAPRRRTSPAYWRQPHAWQREALASGRRPRVFCASLADWLDHEVPVAWRAELLALIKATPHLDWLLLTKRPEAWRARLGEVVAMEIAAGPAGVDQCSGAALAAAWLNGAAPANVWIGATVEDQPRADERIPHLRAIPARVRFLSCEPLLGPVDLLQYGVPLGSRPPAMPGIDWVIAGGESGRGVRPMHPAWVRSLRDQCAAAGTAFFFKQWGEWLPGEATSASGTAYARCDTGEIYGIAGNPKRDNFGTHPDRNSGPLIALRLGKSAAGRLLDGRLHNAFPA